MPVFLALAAHLAPSLFIIKLGTADLGPPDRIPGECIVRNNWMGELHHERALSTMRPREPAHIRDLDVNPGIRPEILILGNQLLLQVLNILQINSMHQYTVNHDPPG